MFNLVLSYSNYLETILFFKKRSNRKVFLSHEPTIDNKRCSKNFATYIKKLQNFFSMANNKTVYAEEILEKL